MTRSRELSMSIHQFRDLFPTLEHSSLYLTSGSSPIGKVTIRPRILISQICNRKTESWQFTWSDFIRLIVFGALAGGQSWDNDDLQIYSCKKITVKIGEGRCDTHVLTEERRQFTFLRCSNETDSILEDGTVGKKQMEQMFCCQLRRKHFLNRGFRRFVIRRRWAKFERRHGE